MVMNIDVREDQGAAAMFVGSRLEGLPLQTIKRKNRKVTLVYEKEL
jgi:hypothetical protein